MMNTVFPTPTVDCLQSEANDQTRYSFLQLKFERATVYAVYAQDAASCALELLGDAREAAERAFRQVVAGALSPIHLYDWTCDWRKETEFGESFS